MNYQMNFYRILGVDCTDGECVNAGIKIVIVKLSTSYCFEKIV